MKTIQSLLHFFFSTLSMGLRSGLIFSICLLNISLVAQNTSYRLKGRLVQMQAGKKVGIKNMMVEIPGIGRDRTTDDGTFQITIPFHLKFAKVEVPETGQKFIFPDLLEMPPPNNFTEILLCCGSETNQDFTEKVKEVHILVEQSKASKKLSERQIIQLKKSLIDTVLHYETELFLNRQDLAKIQNQLKNEQKENLVLQDSLQVFQQQIDLLNQKVLELTRDLHFALDEKYQRQQAYLLTISTELQDYLDKLKDLRDWLPRIDNYYRNAQAREQFIATCKDYEAAWKVISLSHEEQLTAVQHFWTNPLVANNLDHLYNRILHEIHDDLIINNLNKQVISPMQDWAARTKGLILARKETIKSADALLKILNPEIKRLEENLVEFMKQLQYEL